MFRALSFACLFAATLSSRASTANTLAAEVERLATGYLKTRTNGALVIGVAQGEDSCARGFGRVSDTNPQVPDANTVFEIGSITKVFSGILLAILAEDGLLKLDDRADKYLPDGVKLPEQDGRFITLLDLATHSSGLRRLPDNLKLTANPYASYSPKDLYACLGLTKLRRKPGTDVEYSNFAFGVLGHVLELRSGKSYEWLARERLFLPLGMSNTVIRFESQHRERLAPGHDHKGRPVGNWDFDVLAGAGALRSSVSDMLKFLAANLRPEKTSLGKPLQLAQKTHFKSPSGTRMGLGWHKLDTKEGLPVIWHNGGTGGYVSFLGLDPKRQIGVVALSNYGDALAGDYSLDKLALQILKFLAGPPSN